MHSYLEACNTIVVWFSNRTGSFDKFVSTSAISYEVQCNIIASGEVERALVVLTSLSVQALFLMKFSAIVLLLEELKGLLSTTLLQTLK